SRQKSLNKQTESRQHSERRMSATARHRHLGTSWVALDQRLLHAYRSGQQALGEEPKMTHVFDEVISSRERLREIMGLPNHRVASKVVDHIDDICRCFIAASAQAASSPSTAWCTLRPTVRWPASSRGRASRVSS